MSTGLGHVMNISQTAIGKGTVGEPPKAPAGKAGITVRVAIFFDGTKNNRTNTAKRLDDKNGYMLKLKGSGSSYANFYSNPAIHEFMNKRRDPAKHEYSVYVEGIGTEDFSNEAQAAGTVSDKKNGQDSLLGNGFGASSAGIREKVNKGINEVQAQVSAGYDPEEKFIEKIYVDVFGFSRGAAARHFVSRRKFLYGPWPDQSRPELIINFLGLYDTVSSFAHQGRNFAALAWHMVRHGTNTDKLFGNDVRELGLDLGAADEHRQNFSLTNINTSLKAGVGVELRLPGVHSDIGGSYAERDPDNPTMDPSKPIRDLNQESRQVRSTSERQRLIEEGWYTEEQFQERPAPWRVRVLGTQPAEPRLTGVRYLTNEYQYVTLQLMHQFAAGQFGGGHEPMELEDFGEDRNAAYRVPPPLQSLAQHFATEAQTRGRQPAERDDAQYPNGTPPEEITCRSEAETKWLRNHYLHRSAKQKGDFEPLGMEKRKQELRLVIPDDDPTYVPPSQRPAPATVAIPAGEH